MIKISVIVIGYNVERYIERCIKSIVSQTLNDIEIIYVDDGSRDKTVELLRKNYSDKVNIITQKNSGPYNARMNGLSNAKGKYILFVDGDDWIEKYTLKDLYNCIERNNLNIVFFDYVKNNCIKNEIIHNRLTLSPNCIIEKEEIIQKIYKNCMKNSNYSSPCNKIIRLDYIKSLNIRESFDLKYGEDLVFLMELYDKMEKTFYIPKEFYHYCINNSDSLSQKHYEDAFFKIHKELYKIRYNYACKWHVEEYLFNNTCYMAICELIYDIKHIGLKAIKKYIYDDIFKTVIKQCKIKTYIFETKSKKTVLLVYFFKLIYLFV